MPALSSSKNSALAALEASRGAAPALAKELLDQFGGPGGLAKELKIEYHAANEGSMMRSRLLDAIMRIIVKGYEWEKEDSDEWDQVPIDEIERELDRRKAAADAARTV